MTRIFRKIWQKIVGGFRYESAHVFKPFENFPGMLRRLLLKPFIWLIWWELKRSGYRVVLKQGYGRVIGVTHEIVPAGIIIRLTITPLNGFTINGNAPPNRFQQVFRLDLRDFKMTNGIFIHKDSRHAI